MFFPPKPGPQETVVVFDDSICLYLTLEGDKSRQYIVIVGRKEFPDIGKVIMGMEVTPINGKLVRVRVNKIA